MQQDQKKLCNALVHIINRCNDFGRTQLVKTIFFADLIHSNMGETLMFPSTYKRRDHGPTSEMAMDLTNINKENPFLDITEEIGEYSQYTYTPKVNEDLSDFPTYQLEILDAATCLVQRAGSARRISDLTHEFSLWKDVKPNEFIPEKHFQLNGEDCSLLSTKGGIYLTPFTREFYKAMSTPTAASEIARILPRLSCSYPDDFQWDEGLDAYLAWESAMRFCCRIAPAMLEDLRDLGLGLVAGITSSGVNPARFRNHATICERNFNKICEIAALTEGTVLSDTEKDSVNSVMQAIRCELRQNA